MQENCCEKREALIVVIRANSRLQMITATAALSEFIDAAENEIEEIIVVSSAPNKIPPDLAGFEGVLSEIAPVQFLHIGHMGKKLKALPKKRRILSISSSLFPHDVVFFGLKNGVVPQLIATEEGIGTYRGLRGRIHLLWVSPSIRRFRDIVTCIISAAAAPIFKQRNRRLLCKNGAPDPSFNFWMKAVIKKLVGSLDDDFHKKISEAQLDIIIAAPLDPKELINYTNECIGKSILVKKHPHFGIDDLNLAPIREVAGEVVVYTGALSIEELCVLSGVPKLLATNSSSLIYASLVAKVDAVNITNAPSKFWGRKDLFKIYSRRFYDSRP